ncbi:MAG: radical SAM family heme chaperone HemW [Phycisphaerales bacterium]|nr:radical SAM family heme chaperone HemW [Phycisphaerales bacterium]
MKEDLQLSQATMSVKNAFLPGEEQLDIQSLFSSTPDATPVVEGIYAHVPFCAHRCHYCDFFTVAGREDEHQAFVKRILEEMGSFPKEAVGSSIDAIFVGGGTPTILSSELLARFLGGLQAHFLGVDTEFTVEANPETISPEIAGTLAMNGVNRVSLGAQSFQPVLLERLQRKHDPDNVARSLEHLREAGVERISLDLIFGIPGQQLAQWQADLEMAISLNPGHLSCYGLIYEPGTPLRGRLDRGEILAVPEEDEVSMYQWTISRLAEAGYEQYEISNWAKPGEICRHNLLYWHNRNWWAFGPSASGHVDGLRWRNLPRLGRYLAGQGLSTVFDMERLEEDGRIGERFMMGLRCISGLAREEVDGMLSGEGGGRRRPIMERHLADGLLHWSKEDRLCLSQRGLLLANLVVADLLAPGPEHGTDS